MAIIQIDTWDYYTNLLTKYDEVAGTPVVNGSGGIEDSPYLRVKNEALGLTQAFVGKFFDTSNGWTIGFSFRFTHFATLDIFAGVFSDNGFGWDFLAFAINASQQVALRVDPGNIISARGPGFSVSAGQGHNFTEWSYIEVQVVHGASGSVIVRQDNVEILRIVGVNTGQPTNRIILGQLSGKTGGSGLFQLFGGFWYDYDNLYISNTLGGLRFYGVQSMAALRGIEDGPRIEWTPYPVSTDPHYEQVDDPVQPDGDSTFNYSNAPGDVDSFRMEPVAATEDVINALQFNITARIEGTTARHVAGYVRTSGGAEADVGDDNVPSNYKQIIIASMRHPITGVEWTVDDINNGYLGYMLVS